MFSFVYQSCRLFIIVYKDIVVLIINRLHNLLVIVTRELQTGIFLNVRPSALINRYRESHYVSI